MDNKMKYTRLDKDEALNSLAELLKPGINIYGDVVKVSANGMNRQVKYYVIPEANSIIDVTDYISVLGDYNTDKTTRAMKIKGCGMDMLFAGIYYSIGLIKEPFDGNELAQNYRKF